MRLKQDTKGLVGAPLQALSSLDGKAARVLAVSVGRHIVTPRSSAAERQVP